jgi:adenine deaminase
MVSQVSDFILDMPKAELHMHIEGALEPELMFALAARNKVDLPWRNIDELRVAYNFTGLQSFLDIFYQGLRVLVEEQDFYELTLQYLERAHADHVVHCEVYVSPQAHLRRGIAFDTFMRGITRAFIAANEKSGMTGGIILGFQRHLPEEDTFKIVEMAEPWRDHVLGFGLGGAELGNPPAKFERVFAECRARGYRVVAHAGEEGPASYVADTVDLLQVDRVDHGVRCLDDANLVQRLVDRRIPLTVCPCSNVKLGVFARMSEHNLKRMLDAGLMVTVNSDDPSYFGAYVNANYAEAQDALGLTNENLYRMARNGFEAAFLPEARKRFYCEQLDSYWSERSPEPSRGV